VTLRKPPLNTEQGRDRNLTNFRNAIEGYTGNVVMQVQHEGFSYDVSVDFEHGAAVGIAAFNSSKIAEGLGIGFVQEEGTWSISGQGGYLQPDDTDNWWSNFGTAFRLTAGWALWFGEDEIFENDRVSRALINSRIVGEARDYWYKKVNSGEKIITDGLTNFAGEERFGGGNFGFTGLYEAGIDPIEQFVGSTHDISITSDGKTLTYTITNVTSFQSLMYGLTPEFLNFFNNKQTFIFTEPINQKRIK
jgi:hypothetical protein